MAERLSTCQNNCQCEIESTYQTFTKRMKKHNHLLNHLLKTWRRDYLMTLRESHSLKASQKKGSLIYIRDVRSYFERMTSRRDNSGN